METGYEDSCEEEERASGAAIQGKVDKSTHGGGGSAVSDDEESKNKLASDTQSTRHRVIQDPKEESGRPPHHPAIGAGTPSTTV
jgi:hypothetical protein